MSSTEARRFLVIIESVHRVRKLLVGAPGQFEAISDEVRQLSIVLQDAKVLYESEISDEQKKDLQELSVDCDQVLDDLEGTLGYYSGLDPSGGALGNQVKRAWKDLRWEPEDIRELRASLTSRIAQFNALVRRIHYGPKECAYDRVYDDTMKKIEDQLPEKAELATRALSWIFFAKESLTSVELQLALAIEIGKPKLDKENLPQIEHIVSACAGLVTVDGESGIVGLVHYTTQDYFKRSRTRWFPNAEADIAAACVTYLSFSTFSSRGCHGAEEFAERLRSNQLYGYAACNWGHHAREADTPIQAVDNFFRNKAQIEAAYDALVNTGYRAWEDRNYWGRFPKQVTGMHLAAYFGIKNLIHQILGSDDLDVTNSWGQSPLHLAARNGHEAVVRLLLEKGASFNLGDDCDVTPLHKAAQEGHEAIVKLLLEKGADLDLKDEYNKTPLYRAAECGHEAIVKLLLEKGADFNLRNICNETPLYIAAESGHEAIVKLLLEKRAGLGSRDAEENAKLARCSGQSRDRE